MFAIPHFIDGRHVAPASGHYLDNVEPATGRSPSEVRMLVTAAAQLAPLVSEASLLERVVAAAHDPAPRCWMRRLQASAANRCS